MHEKEPKPTSLATTIAVCSGLAFLSMVMPVHAQLNMTGGTIRPGVGPYDQSYLPGAVVEGTDTMGSPFGYSGNNDQYSYISSPDRTSKAQSFTTGTNAAGYLFRRSRCVRRIREAVPGRTTVLFIWSTLAISLRCALEQYQARLTR